MLEIVIPGTRHGEGFIYGDTVYRGCMCYISGMNSDGKALLSVPGDSAQAKRAVYPVNKLYFEEDYNDTSDAVDKFTTGDSCVYYEGGEYITDKWDILSATDVVPHVYWNKTTPDASVYGVNHYNAGNDSALGTFGITKVFVSTGPGSGLGYLLLSTATNTYADPDDCYVGFLTDMFYQDSANAYVRFRVAPAKANAWIG